MHVHAGISLLISAFASALLLMLVGLATANFPNASLSQAWRFAVTGGVA